MYEPNLQHVDTWIGCISTCCLYYFFRLFFSLDPRSEALIQKDRKKLEGCLPKLPLCCSSAAHPTQPVLLFSLEVPPDPGEKVKWFTASHLQRRRDTQESRPLAEAAALSALGRGSGPFRAMFAEARHRPFVMVSMCVCKRACAQEDGGGGREQLRNGPILVPAAVDCLVRLYWPTVGAVPVWSGCRSNVGTFRVLMHWNEPHLGDISSLKMSFPHIIW